MRSMPAIGRLAVAGAGFPTAWSVFEPTEPPT
jgi:hypothetical protein